VGTREATTWLLGPPDADKHLAILEAVAAPDTTTGVVAATPSTRGAWSPRIAPVGTASSDSRSRLSGASAVPWCSDSSVNPVRVHTPIVPRTRRGHRSRGWPWCVRGFAKGRAPH
jgi:hypothetical protein